jgi:hypothetical protein
VIESVEEKVEEVDKLFIDMILIYVNFQSGLSLKDFPGHKVQGDL